MADETKDIYYVEGTLPETPLPGKEPPPWKATSVVGKPLPRVDAYERVSGSAVYPSDVRLPNMLHGAILRCPHPHARVRRVDTSAALKVPGVRVVVSGATPEADLVFKKDPVGDMRLFDSICRYEGDAVAAVAAETPYQAWDAVNAIRVDYEVLPFVADERRALQPGAAARAPEGQPLQEGQLPARGCGPGLRRGRRGAGGDLPHRVRAAHAPRAARLRRQLGRAVR